MNYNAYRFWEPLLQDLVGYGNTRYFLERSKNSPGQMRVIIELNGLRTYEIVYQLKKSCRTARKDDFVGFGCKNTVDAWLEMVAVYESERQRVMTRVGAIKQELIQARKLGNATS